MDVTELEPIATMCENAVADGIVPGIALSVLQAGQAPRRCVHGWRAIEPDRQSLEIDTLFDLASLTKVLATTWLLMQRSEEGLDLDAPLDALLPGYFPTDKRALTIRLLMTHAAGFPSGIRVRDHFTADEASLPDTRRKAIDAFLAAPLRHAPGSETLYSDIGPILVGDLLEQLAGGQRLDAQCRARLYEPVGLGQTGFRPLDEVAAVPDQRCAATEHCQWRHRVVQGQVHDENAFLLNGVAGHAGLFAPLGDLERVAAMLLAPPATGPLNATTVEVFTRRQSIVAGSTRAIGWDTARPGCPGGSRLTETAFGHTGFTGTSMWIDREQELAVVVLGNRVHPTRDNDRFLAFRPRLHDAIVEHLGP